MKKAIGIVAALVAAGPAAAQFGADESGARSFHRPNGSWVEAAFVCDGVARDRAYVVTDEGGKRVTLWRYAKPGLAARSVSLRLGKGDAAMMQQYQPLLDARGQQAALVHTISPGVVEPGATTPTVTWIKIGDDTTDCRFAPQTRVLGVSAKRSVQVVALPGGGYRYTAYTHGGPLTLLDLPWGGRDSAASLTIDGGYVVSSAATQVYVFQNAGYTYRVIAGTAARPGAGIEVLHNGQLILREAFGAYTVAAKR